MPIWPNPPWSDITTTTRENRSAEHGSLFTNKDPSKVSLEPKSPVHPIIPKKWNSTSKHKIRAPKTPGYRK